MSVNVTSNLIIKLAKIDLNLSKGMLLIPTIDPSTAPNFGDSSTMCLVHNGSNKTISIPGGYVYDNSNHGECSLRVVKSLLGLRL